MKALTYVELDLDYCALTYGTAPCTASIPTTGAAKCFNSLKTCQDRENFDNVPVTLRFAMPTDYLPSTIEAIPSLANVSFSPAEISLGQNLGVRGTLTVTFKDHRHSDTGAGFDKYLADRDYDPFRQGSFFGKFRARHPFLRGRPIRLIRGFLGDALEDMTTRHYVMDSFDGPTPDGVYTIIAKDILKLADDDRAQAPRLSEGFLVAGIDDNDTTATLSPAGIGNNQYPASGKAALGGKEIVSFTRSGDVLTITRAQHNTVAQAHSEDDRVQLCLEYSAEDPADIIADLLENYADVPSGYIPLSAWQTETASYLQRVYTTLIAEPTGVNKLISELVEQAALAMWWDDAGSQIRLQVLRAVPTTAQTFTDAHYQKGSLRTREQPDKRLSQVWVYFGRRDPLKSLDQVDNYRSTALIVDVQAQSDYGSPALKKIFSRWIPPFGRSVAQRLGDIVLGRFRDPPRSVAFDLFPTEAVALGGGYRLEAWPVQDEFGARADLPFQITRHNPQVDKHIIEGEEVLFQNFDLDDLTNRVIIVDSNVLNFNLKEVHDSLYPELTDDDVDDGVNLTCVVEAGVIVGSASITLPGFDVGTGWPVDFPIQVTVVGRLQARGGNGTSTGGILAQKGGTALYTRFPINLTYTDGEIWSGGGGGGWGNLGSAGRNGGGGGAGTNVGFGGGGAVLGGAGSNGTDTAGGAGGVRTGSPGFDGGAGGGPGLNGSNGGGTPLAGGYSTGGQKGNAIDGVSYVTVVGATGDLRGTTLN